MKMQFLNHLRQYPNLFHALHHIGIHYWLEETNYNYGKEAKIFAYHTNNIQVINLRSTHINCRFDLLLTSC